MDFARLLTPRRLAESTSGSSEKKDPEAELHDPSFIGLAKPSFSE
jgi:hypothetical protein